MIKDIEQYGEKTWCFSVDAELSEEELRDLPGVIDFVYKQIEGRPYFEKKHEDQFRWILQDKADRDYTDDYLKSVFLKKLVGNLTNDTILSMERKGYIDRIEYLSPNEMDKLKRHIQDGDLCEIVDKDLKAIFLVSSVKFFEANGIRFTLGLVRLL